MPTSLPLNPIIRFLPAIRNIMFSQVVTYIILSGTLILLFNVFFTGFFLATPPRGDRAMILAERLTEELSAFSDTAPLWTIISYLPDVPAVKPLDAECRAIVVARALQVPDFDNELHSCMTSDQYFYRQAAADFLTAVPQDTLIANQSAWATSLIAGLRATGAGIADRPDWPTETFDNNPSPIAHVRALLLAVDRFKASSHYPQMQQLFAQMADDSAVLNPSPDREQLLNLLANAGFRPRVQIRN
jgi:hypothetical protein